MNLLFRFLFTLLASRFKSPLDVLDESVVTLRVWPNDLDLNFHMNNGRYLSIMDLGRMDLLARAGVLRKALQRGWFPMVGDAKIRFRLPLHCFQRFRLRSRVLCWDEKWFYLEQIIERDGEQAAIGYLRALLRSKEGSLTPETILAAFGKSRPSPPMPEAIAFWRNAP